MVSVDHSPPPEYLPPLGVAKLGVESPVTAMFIDVMTSVRVSCHAH